MIAKLIRDYIISCPSFTETGIAQSDFLIDGNMSSPCMSLQLNPGTVVEEYIDGYKTISLPFTLLRKENYTDSVTVRNDIIASLDSIASELVETPIIQKNEDVEVKYFTQLSTPSINEQDNKSVVYAVQIEIVYSYTE